MAGFWVVQSRVYFFLKRQRGAPGAPSLLRQPWEHIPLQVRAPTTLACRGNPSVGFHISAPVSPCSKKRRKRRGRGGSAARVIFSELFRRGAERGEKFREYNVPQAASRIKRHSAASGGQPPPQTAPAPLDFGAKTLKRITFAA